MTTITWDGPTEGYSAYAIINRNLIAAMRERGHTVVLDQHMDDDGEMTDVLISCVYPPKPVVIPHKQNICISTWEFHGPHNTPSTFLEAFATYDVVWAMCEQAAHAFQESGVQNVIEGALGVSEHFRQRIPLSNMDAELVWVGGTDARHGIDIAVAVMDRLPESFKLYMKIGSYYPFDGLKHPRIFVDNEDRLDMSTFYQGRNAFLLTARAVAPSLPVMEALACGLAVAAPDLPAMREFKEWEIGQHIFTAPVKSLPFRHHLHHDCQPYWHEVDVDKLAEAVIKAVDNPPPHVYADAFRDIFSWEQSAILLEEVLNVQED